MVSLVHVWNIGLWVSQDSISSDSDDWLAVSASQLRGAPQCAAFGNSASASAVLRECIGVACTCNKLQRSHSIHRFARLSSLLLLISVCKCLPQLQGSLDHPKLELSLMAA